MKTFLVFKTEEKNPEILQKSVLGCSKKSTQGGDVDVDDDVVDEEEKQSRHGSLGRQNLQPPPILVDKKIHPPEIRRPGIRRLGIRRLGICQLGIRRLGIRQLGICRLGIRRLGIRRPEICRLEICRPTLKRSKCYLNNPSYLM